MSMVDGTDILGFVVLGGFVGFTVFFISYASVVWLQRNRNNQSQHTLIFKVGVALVLSSVIGVIGSWILSYYTQRDGIVDGDNLFVVHARRDAAVTHLVTERKVLAGEIIAKFRPPETDAEIAVFDSRIKEARVRLGFLKSRFLQLDPVLHQKQAQLRAQMDQQKQFQFDLQRAKRDLEEKYLLLTTTWAKERDHVEAELRSVRTILDAQPDQMTIAQNQWNRTNQLREKALTSEQTLDDRKVSVLALELEREKLDVALASLTRRVLVLDERYREEAKAISMQTVTIDSDARSVAQLLTSLATQFQITENSIARDRIRAEQLMARELEMTQRQVETLAAERDKALAATQVKAPFEGHVVYWHPAPSLAQDGSPLLAISPGTGFTAKVWLPASEVAAVTEAGEVKFALEHPVLKRYFSGTFRKIEVAAFEQDRVVSHFDAKIPAEAVALLEGNREPPRVRLLWQPPFLASTGSKAGFALFGIGCLLIGADSLKASSRSPMSVAQRPTFRGSEIDAA